MLILPQLFVINNYEGEPVNWDIILAKIISITRLLAVRSSLKLIQAWNFRNYVVSFGVLVRPVV